MAKPRAVAKKPKKAMTPGRRRRRGVLVFFMMLIILAALVAAWKIVSKPALKKVALEPVSLWSGEGNGRGQLHSPRGLGIGPKGEIAVTDLLNNRVVVFDKAGKFVTAFGKEGKRPEGAGESKTGDFNEPSGAAIAPNGDILVADSWNGRIQRFSAGGSFKVEYGGPRFGFYSPRNVAVDKNDVIYVADTGRSRVVAILPNGKTKEFGEKGRGGGRFNEVFGLAIGSKGDIFVADPGNARIHKFSPLPEAKFLKDVKVPGWAQGTFWPQLAVDEEDHVYAMDNQNRVIWVYSSELKYIATLSSPEGRELFGNPVGIAYAGNGELIVSDAGKSQMIRVHVPALPAQK